MIAESTTIIGELENSLGVPTFAFLSHWIGEYAVDADEEAGRLLVSTVVDRLRRENADEIALILVARGGYPIFADAVIRAMRHLDVDLQVLLPARVDGAASLLTLAAEKITLHPQAGLGAVDSGLCVAPRRPFNAALHAYSAVDPVSLLEMEEGSRAEMARLAYDRLIRHEQRRTAAHLLSGRDLDEAQIASFTTDTLGAGLSAGATQLDQASFDVRVAPAPLAEQLEALLAWGQEALSLFRSPQERFQLSDGLADEVEFEPATLVPAAAVVSIDAVWLHELDTGSPDPDAPKLMGHWRSWDPASRDSE